MNLIPSRSIELAHRAYYMKHAGKRFAVAAQDGHVSLFDQQFRFESIRAVKQHLRGISIHPSSDLLAFTDNDCLSICDLSGNVIFRDASPGLSDDSPSWLNGGFDDCQFHPQDGSLWSVSARSTEKLEIQVRDPILWTIKHKVELEDPYRGSSCSFHTVPNSKTLALWIAGGQDGQEIYWLTCDRKLHAKRDALLEDTTPPDFSPNGAEFLILENYQAICRISYPNTRELSRLEWPFADDDCFGCSFAYIDDQYAMVGTNAGRSFLLDVPSMSLIDEVVIANHEPRPVEQLYPSLVGDKSLCTDIHGFMRFGNMIVASFRRDGGDELEGWKDTLLLFDCQSIRASISSQIP